MNRFIAGLVVLVALVGSSTAYAGTRLIFPHLALGAIGDGTVWFTQIGIVNLSSSPNTIKLSFFNPNGTPKFVFDPNGGPWYRGDTVTGKVYSNLFPNGFVNFAVESAQPSVNTGWVLAEGTGEIAGSLIFRRMRVPFLEPATIIAEAVTLPHSPTNRIAFLHFPQRPQADLFVGDDPQSRAQVGYALVNPSSTEAVTVVIKLYRQYLGSLKATAEITLPPRGQLSEFVFERFNLSPDDPENYYINIGTTSGTVSAVALRLLGNGLITTIPVE